MADILVAKINAVIIFEGRRIIVQKGITHVRAGHPILAGREKLFGPVVIDFDLEHGDVEQATAAPGEKRRVSTGRRKRATTEQPAKEQPDTEQADTGSAD